MTWYLLDPASAYPTCVMKVLYTHARWASIAADEDEGRVMGHLSGAQLRKMRNKYPHDVAEYLAGRACDNQLVTYGELSEKFGGIARGWGDVLGGIALRCHDRDLPLLPVIVVEARSQKPSVDAVLYEDLGLKDSESVLAEQARCFAQDWSITPLDRALR